MKIAAGTLFLGLSFCLCSIKLTRSQPRPPELTTISNLFPETDGIHLPDIVEIAHAIPRSTTLNSQPMIRYPRSFVKRGHVIFGYKQHGTDDIEWLSRLFGEEFQNFVFNTQNREWYELSSFDIQRIGVGRNVKLVRAHDEASATVHHSYLHFIPQEMPQDHIRASVNAYYRAKSQEYVEMYNLDHDLVTPERAAQKVKSKYFRGYDEIRYRQGAH